MRLPRLRHVPRPSKRVSAIAGGLLITVSLCLPLSSAEAKGPGPGSSKTSTRQGQKWAKRPYIRPSARRTPVPTATPSASPSTTTPPAAPTPSTSSTPTPTTTSRPTSTPTPTAPHVTSTPTPTAPAVTTPPTPTVAPSTPAGSWPGPGNTGVPAATALTKYTGPCTITKDGTTLTKVDATGCGMLEIKARNVTITTSRVPIINATADGMSVAISDSDVTAGEWSGGAVWGQNITATRLNVTGGQHSVHCAGNCTVVDSWLHDQYNPAGQAYHNNAFISNGGSTMVVRHNTLACTPSNNSTGGGCTADLSLFGDFAPISDVIVDGNLFVANNNGISYCLHAGYNASKKYGTNPTGIKITNNVFQSGPNGLCGVWGPVTSFLSTGAGNVWSNNTFDRGGPVNPAKG